MKYRKNFRPAPTHKTKRLFSLPTPPRPGEKTINVPETGDVDEVS